MLFYVKFFSDLIWKSRDFFKSCLNFLKFKLCHTNLYKTMGEVVDNNKSSYITSAFPSKTRPNLK